MNSTNKNQQNQQTKNYQVQPRTSNANIEQECGDTQKIHIVQSNTKLDSSENVSDHTEKLSESTGKMSNIAREYSDLFDVLQARHGKVILKDSLNISNIDDHNFAQLPTQPDNIQIKHFNIMDFKTQIDTNRQSINTIDKQLNTILDQINNQQDTRCSIIKSDGSIFNYIDPQIQNYEIQNDPSIKIFNLAGGASINMLTLMDQFNSLNDQQQ